ncbi:hypothetical protein FCN80_04145 [Martelella alba]|uniref:Uncharacterized protein n=2 Tax=Martelella alba TaxID=2590451 RepID=A0ABY2SQF6_9HYPH|nr:hypothetical protein FCN80_04145 [Martelella alba]
MVRQKCSGIRRSYLAGGVKKFGDYLNSPEFPNDVRAFMDGLGKLINGISRSYHWIVGDDNSDLPWGVRSANGAPVSSSGNPGFNFLGRPAAPDIINSQEPVGSSGLEKRNWLAGPLDWIVDKHRELVNWTYHNPLNLRSAPGVPSVNGFASFKNSDDGIRAAWAQLQRYANGQFNGKNINTINDIVSTFAPKSDHNDTDSYIRFVSQRMGVDPNAHLNLNDSGIMSQLISAMAKRESGSDYSPSTIIRIENATGGNATVISSQLAH